MSGQREEAIDAYVRQRLREALPEPPVDEVDWAALRLRIARQSELALARLRRSPRGVNWWDYAARWAMPALPAALAAAAVLALLLGRLEQQTPPQPTTVASAERITVETAIGATPRDEETSVLFTARDRDALLREAVER